MVHSITYINYTKKDVINQGEKSLEINLDFFAMLNSPIIKLALHLQHTIHILELLNEYFTSALKLCLIKKGKIKEKLAFKLNFIP